MPDLAPCGSSCFWKQNCSYNGVISIMPMHFRNNRWPPYMQFKKWVPVVLPSIYPLRRGIHLRGQQQAIQRQAYMSSSTLARHHLTLLLGYQRISELKKLGFVRSLHCLNILLKYTTFSLFQSKIYHKTSYHLVMSIHLLATMHTWTQYSSYALNFFKPISLVYFEPFQVPLYLGAQINYRKF